MSTESARDRFHVGMRVKPTSLGLERKVVRRRLGVEAADRRGIVTGFKSTDPGIVRVQIWPNATSTKFHATFWEPDEMPEPRPAA